MLRSTGFRFFVVGLLALIMFIPLFFVGAVIDSRAGYSREAIASVGEEWGGAQTVAGPVLVLPVEAEVTRLVPKRIVNAATGEVRIEETETTEIVRAAPLRILPDRFDVAIRTESEVRRRGIFEVPVYFAALEAGFDFDLADLEARLGDKETLLWEEARILVGLSSNRALRGEAVLRSGTDRIGLDPWIGEAGRTGIEAAIGDPRDRDGYALALGFNGAGRLLLAPVGRTTSARMESDWPHPSFTGRFLPTTSGVGADGFEASWTIPHLARSLPQVSREAVIGSAMAEAFGVRFFQPNDFYQKAYRAARYGILFIALTFLTVLLTERTQDRPAHPVQYILIGLAQSIFVLLMVAYAEQFGFGLAYLLSAGATVGLITAYGATGLRLGRRTWILGLVLSVLYGVLYLILGSADYALISGATLAFAALAGTMAATRNEEWYGPDRPGQTGRRWFRGAAAPTEPTPRPEQP